MKGKKSVGVTLFHPIVITMGKNSGGGGYTVFPLLNKGEEEWGCTVFPLLNKGEEEWGVHCFFPS